MLRLRNVNTFIKHKQIINQATFDLEAGDIVGLVGPNGAGKTTIMKTILGLTKFTGNVLVDQVPVTETNHAALTNVGALIEHPAIYPFLTGRQNLNLYSRDPQDLETLVKTLKMTAYIDTSAKGYSLGMKQKLGIAIGVLNHPKLVILDEPMNGLDVETTIGVRRLIKQYAEQGTAFKLVIFCKKSSHQVKVPMAALYFGLIVLRIFSQNNGDGGC